MSPERARVFVIDDAQDWQDRIRRLLEDAGHQVVCTASTPEEARKIIPELQRKKVQVAIVDTDLGSGTGADGRNLMESLRKHAPHVKIISNGMVSVSGVDMNVTKLRCNMHLPAAVTKL